MLYLKVHGCASKIHFFLYDQEILIELPYLSKKFREQQ